MKLQYILIDLFTVIIDVGYSQIVSLQPSNDDQSVNNTTFLFRCSCFLKECLLNAFIKTFWAILNQHFKTRVSTQYSLCLSKGVNGCVHAVPILVIYSILKCYTILDVEGNNLCDITAMHIRCKSSNFTGLCTLSSTKFREHDIENIQDPFRYLIYHKISQSPKPAKSGIKILISLWNLSGASVCHIQSDWRTLNTNLEPPGFCWIFRYILCDWKRGSELNATGPVCGKATSSTASRKQIIKRMMASSNGNIPRYWPFVRGIHRSPMDSPSHRPVTRSFGDSFDVHLNKCLSKPLRCPCLKRHGAHCHINGKALPWGFIGVCSLRVTGLREVSPANRP